MMLLILYACGPQVREYAERKKMELKDAERWLATMLNYEP